MSEIIEKEYYEKNPMYSEIDCFKCKEKTMRLIGIECFDEYDREDKSFYRCEKCGQEAYIEVEWLFTIFVPKQN